VVLSEAETITLTSNGQTVYSKQRGPGLAYDSVTGLNPGDQVMTVGSYVASGGRCVKSACQDAIYNFNAQHVGLDEGGTQTSCWSPHGSGVANLIDDTSRGVTYTKLSPGSSC
jgi:hypothetical protein